MRLQAFVTALAVLALTAGCSSDDEPEGIFQGSSESSDDTKSTTLDDITATTDAEEETTTTTAPEPVDLTIEAGMFSEINSIGTRNSAAGVVLTNPNAEAAYDVDVVFNLVDGAGTVMDTASANVDYLAPGGRAIVAPLQIGFDIPSEPVRVDVTAIVGDFREDEGYDGVEFSMSEGIVLEVVSVEVQRGQYGDTRIGGQVRNPSDQLAEFASIDCIARAGGVIVGGWSTSLTDPVAPGGIIAFNVGARPLSPSADTAECQIIG